MEAVRYDHAGENTALRRADLRRAMQAFLADTCSCAAIKIVGLFVSIPAPSSITAATLLSTAEMSNHPTSSSAELSQAPQRQRRVQKLAWCALEAERRLRQASADAAELNRWLLHGALNRQMQSGNTDADQSHNSKGSSRSSALSSLCPPASAGVKVVVVAYLAPQSREDVAVYEGWQRCAEACTAASLLSGGSGSSSSGIDASRTTRRLSPLRRATFVAVSLGAPSLLLSWAERTVRCFLSSLLLPHQSLLMDLSWCIDALHAPNAEVAEAGRTGASGSGRVRLTGQVRFDLFVHDVLPTLKFPKGDSRCALWLSYACLMAALHPRVFAGEGAELSLAAHALQRESSHRQGRSGGSGSNAEAFAKTYRVIGQVFAALFESSPTAPGRNQALRVLLGYGDHLSTLKRQLVHVAGVEHRHRGGGGTYGFPTSTATAAALLRTRNLVDIYALFGVLMGKDRVDFYAAAASFVRTAVRRSATPSVASAAAAAIAVTHALESTLVQVDSFDTATAPASHGASNTFVEIGARALAYKRARLERRRLGKGREHLRPRSRAARARKHLLERKARQTSTLKDVNKREALPTAGKRSRSEQASASERVQESCAVASASAGSSPAKKLRGEAAALPAKVNGPTSETLSWSVDIG